MNKKMVGIFVCILFIAATVIPVAGTLINLNNIAIDSSESEDASTSYMGKWYNPAGSWMRSDKYLLLTYTLAGPGLNRYALSYEYIHDSTWWILDYPDYIGLYPDAVGATDGRGDLIRTGLNTYDFTLLAIGYDEDYSIEYYSVYSGTTEFTGPDTSSATFTLAFYNSTQDPFSDDVPEYCFGPYTYTYERIPLVPLCGSC